MKHTFIGCEIESYAFAVKIVPLTGKNETAVEIDAVLVCRVMRLHRLLHKLTLFVIRSREDDNHFVTRFRLEIDTLCYPDQDIRRLVHASAGIQFYDEWQKDGRFWSRKQVIYKAAICACCSSSS